MINAKEVSVLPSFYCRPPAGAIRNECRPGTGNPVAQSSIHNAEPGSDPEVFMRYLHTTATLFLLLATTVSQAQTARPAFQLSRIDGEIVRHFQQAWRMSGN